MHIYKIHIEQRKVINTTETTNVKQILINPLKRRIVTIKMYLKMIINAFHILENHSPF